MICELVVSVRKRNGCATNSELDVYYCSPCGETFASLSTAMRFALARTKGSPLSPHTTNTYENPCCRHRSKSPPKTEAIVNTPHSTCPFADIKARGLCIIHTQNKKHKITMICCKRQVIQMTIRKDADHARTKAMMIVLRKRFQNGASKAQLEMLKKMFLEGEYQLEQDYNLGRFDKAPQESE